MKNQPNTNRELKRELSLFSATVVVIASMVGTGIFTSPGFIIAQVGNPAAFGLCWLAGGLFALCGALCYGELGVRFPRAGGEYVYLHNAFGPCLGFLSGWLSLIVGFSAPIAASAMAFAAYLIPGSEPEAAKATACGVIVGITLLHTHSLKLGTRVQNGLTLLKVAIIVGFVTAAVVAGQGDSVHFRVGLQTGGFWDGNWAVALIFVSFAYSGWNAASYLGGEIQRPGRNLPLALAMGTVIVTILYLALNAVFLYALAPTGMAGHTDIGARAATALFGPHAGRWLGLAIAAGLLSVLSAMIMTGPRVYYAMARDGIFFRVFGNLGRHCRTPAAAIFFQGAIAVVMVLSAAFDALLIYIGFTLSLSAMLTVGGMMWLRHCSPMPGGTYRTPCYPLIPAVFILGNGLIVLFVLKSQPAAALFGLATIGLGLLAYRLFIYQSNRFRFAKKTVTSKGDYT